MNLKIIFKINKQWLSNTIIYNSHKFILKICE